MAVGGAVDAGQAAARTGGTFADVATAAARSASDAAEAAAKSAADAAKAAGKTAGDAAKSAAKTASKNANMLLAGGLAAGGLYYLDQQYAEAKEDVKDCMKICLPENWDDHAYGDLEKTGLKYRELENPGDQPVCTENIPDCGKYCGDKCETLHEYDAPGSDLVEGVAGDVGETAGGLLGGLTGGLFGGLGKGLGIDGTTGMLISGASFICCCMLIIMMVLLR